MVKHAISKYWLRQWFLTEKTFDTVWERFSSSNTQGNYWHLIGGGQESYNAQGSFHKERTS